ncbi:probable cation-transporting ATPase 13A3 [Trichonephila inaurata madagascariensis]|uniref:Cation-transporting ATPase n=1 Tax=Trichonephila inaurata madagascariensis TaxID=2747483 RepID=A0A8X6WM42_9ARAC|nr:probable cation-transporting ATPase 13A3 [Trichonephila inaurata madagascariensis]
MCRAIAPEFVSNWLIERIIDVNLRHLTSGHWTFVPLDTFGSADGKIENLKMPYSLLAKGDAPQVITIEESTDDQVEAHGYCESPCKKCLYNIGIFLSCGLLLLFVKWFPQCRVWMTCRPCSVSTADILILKDVHGTTTVLNVNIESASSSIPPELVYSRSVSSISSHSHDSMNFNYSPNISYRHFVHNCGKFVWDSTLSCFKRLRGYEGLPCSEFFEKFQGLTASEENEKREIYGPNCIDVEVKSYFTLFVDEVLNPLYIFQTFSVMLWLFDDYVLYATCIVVITMVSIALALYEVRRQQKTLRDMVSRSNSVLVSVRRPNGAFEEIASANLVPGDIIAIPPNGCHMACDAVLITGNCIVNESMLTGESVPETKTPLSKHDDEFYCPLNHKRNTLFCGTEVIQTRYYENNKVLAVVVRTGFSTAKGELIRSILFPKPFGFKFYMDSLKFVVLLFGISALGMAYSIYCYIIRGAPIAQTIVRALDIITIVVPPALPAAMSIGTVFAQNRLKKQKIYCISPPRINIGGKLKLICFDKTGTLTEEGLDFWGIIPTTEGKFKELEHDVNTLSDHDRMKICMASCHSLTIIDDEIRGDPMDLKMFHATKWEMEEPGSDNTKFDLLNPTVIRPSTNKSSKIPCNGLDGGDIMLTPELNSDDKLISFPLSPTKDNSLLDEMPYEVGIIRQFPFSSALQRMSVMCRTLGSRHMDLYCKGAPEKITSLCLSETVPVNFPELLKDYTLQGYRVLALAHRKLDSKLSWHHAQKIKRDQVEKDLTFLGLLIMQNTLKPETTPVIKALKDAKIRCVMVTGDNVMTAMSVARDCHMIPESDRIIVINGVARDHEKSAHLSFEYAETMNMRNSNSTISEVVSANGDMSPVLTTFIDAVPQHYHFVMDGKTFGVIRKYFPEMLPKILLRGTVFARMAPDQKTQLVESLQNLNYVVGMCGDGANDCGALKAADVGISLSDTEASVAAPFTSNIPNITCVPIVIREGRCSLLTSFATFRFIALYSLTQFVSVLISYTVDTNLTDQMFLYIDMGLITCLAVSMGYTGAYNKVVPQRPRVSLVSVTNVVSLLAQITFVTGTLVGAIIFLQHQKWYEPVHGSKEEGEDIFPCWENTVVFLISSWQYVAIALLVSDGPPYRKHFFTNYFYLAVLALASLCNLFILFNPFKVLAPYLGIVEWEPTQHLMFRVTLLMVVLCNFFLALAFEMLVVNSRWLRWCVRKIKNKKEAKNEYKRIDKELSADYEWPQVNKTVYESGPILISQ